MDFSGDAKAGACPNREGAVQVVRPGVVGAAQRPRLAGCGRLGAGLDGDQLRTAVPADVVVRVQAAVLGDGDQHGLAEHLDDRQPARRREPQLVQAPGAGP